MNYCYLFSYHWSSPKNSGYGEIRFSLNYMDEETFDLCKDFLAKENPGQTFVILNVINLGLTKRVRIKINEKT